MTRCFDCKRLAPLGPKPKSDDLLIQEGHRGMLASGLAQCGYRAPDQTYARFRSWRKDSCLTEKAVIDNFVGVDLLIIDEVGAQFGTPAEALHLFDVISERYAQMKSTIILSNFQLSVTPEQRAAGQVSIADYLGDAAFDRFREAGSRAVAFNWASFRGHKSEGEKNA